MIMYNKKLLFFLLYILTSVTSLLAVDTELLTDYRNNGIKNIEQKLDKQLTQKSYWQEYLKNIDTSFGYLESFDDILACNKAASKLKIYHRDSNNTFTLLNQFHAYTGKNKGDKQTQGDLKTPIGVYCLTKKISNVDPFYGPMAFVTSYPNLYDKYKGKTGQGIWIHGFPLHQKRDAYTKGCIAVHNDNLKSLDKSINLKKALLIIDEKSVNEERAKKDLIAVLSNLFSWRYAWIYNDLDKYLSFYSQNFKRYDGMDLAHFKKYKTRIFHKNEKKTIIFSQINVIPYPETTNLYKITFKENYKSGSFSFNGNKILIVKLSGDKFKIITEQ